MSRIRNSLAAVALIASSLGDVANAAALTTGSVLAGHLEPAALVLPAQGRCRREPVWGFRISAFCKPTGICPDRVIKNYRTVCS